MTVYLYTGIIRRPEEVILWEIYIFPDCRVFIQPLSGLGVDIILLYAVLSGITCGSVHYVIRWVAPLVNEIEALRASGYVIQLYTRVGLLLYSCKLVIRQQGWVYPLCPPWVAPMVNEIEALRASGYVIQLYTRVGLVVVLL